MSNPWEVDRSVKPWVDMRPDAEFRTWATSFPDGSAIRIIADRYERMLPPLRSTFDLEYPTDDAPRNYDEALSRRWLETQ